MGRIDDAFVLENGIAPVEPGHDVRGVDRAQFVPQGDRGGRPERHRLELAGDRGFFKGLEILPGRGEHLFRLVQRDPAFDRGAPHVFVGGDQIELLGDFALDHRKRVSRRPGFMDDQHGGGAHLGAHFIFVGPAAVIGHGPTAECLGIEGRRIGRVGNRRIADQDDHGLALEIDAFVIVPGEFRRLDSVPDEDHFGVGHADGLLESLRPGHIIVFPFQILAAAALAEAQHRAALDGATGQGNFLNIRPVGVARLESEALELVHHVGDAQFLAPSAGRTAFVFIGGQDFHMAQHGGAVDGRQRGHREVDRFGGGRGRLPAGGESDERKNNSQGNGESFHDNLRGKATIVFSISFDNFLAIAPEFNFGQDESRRKNPWLSERFSWPMRPTPTRKNTAPSSTRGSTNSKSSSSGIKPRPWKSAPVSTGRSGSSPFSFAPASLTRT